MSSVLNRLTIVLLTLFSCLDLNVTKPKTWLKKSPHAPATEQAVRLKDETTCEGVNVNAETGVGKLDSGGKKRFF